MIENLRLEAENTRTAEKQALAQGYGTSVTYGNFSGLANAESPWGNYSTTANSLYSTDGSNNTINIGATNATERFPRYNHRNTNSRASRPTANNAAIYSYGNYYTWAAAIANTAAYTTDNESITNTSVCPTGWRLPTGGSSANAINSVFWQLGLSIMGATPMNNDSYQSSEANIDGDTATKAFRRYPNNFIYSGFIYNGSVYSTGTFGRYWSSTISSNYNAYSLYLNNNYVSSGTGGGVKYYGWTIRCTID